VNDLPIGWEITTISDITEYLSRGKQPKYATYSSLPVVNQRAIRWSGIQNEYLKYVDPVQFDQWIPENFIRSGDILWNSTGTGTIGRACLITQRDLNPSKVVDSHVTIIRPIQAAIDPRFLFSWIQSSEVQEKVASLATGATNQIEFSRAMIASMRILIAPLNEQKRIVDKLDELFSRVDACRDQLDHVSLIVKHFRQSVLSAATSGALTDDWRAEAEGLDLEYEIKEISNKFIFEDALCFGDFKFPKNWTVSRLGEIAKIIGGVTKDSKKQSPVDEELPYLRVANVQRGFFDLNEIKTIRVPQKRVNELLLKPGDILFNEGGDLDKLGRGWVWNGEIERCTFQNHVFRVRLHNELFAPKFFSWYGNLRGADYFLSVGKQTTNLASINKSLLSALPIVIPPAEEQQEIVRRVEALFSYADQLEVLHRNACDQVERLIPALLDKAFRGELVPQDPNDEPASVLLERIRTERAAQPITPKRILTNRKTTMTKMSTESVKEIIHQLPMHPLSFDDLREKLLGDYDSLKDILFTLLDESKPSIMQVFDEEEKIIHFVRGDK
jgi:type I restriction enzyme, S subunit